MVAFLEQLVRCESPSSDTSTQAAVRGLLEDELRSLHFRTLPLEGRQSGGQLFARPVSRKRDDPYNSSSDITIRSGRWARLLTCPSTTMASSCAVPASLI